MLCFDLTEVFDAGHKASIILEELKEAYGKPDYVYQSINIGQNIQVLPSLRATNSSEQEADMDVCRKSHGSRIKALTAEFQS